MKKILLFTCVAAGVGTIAVLLKKHAEKAKKYGKHSIGAHSRFPARRNIYEDSLAMDEFDEIMFKSALD